MSQFIPILFCSFLCTGEQQLKKIQIAILIMWVDCNAKETIILLNLVESGELQILTLKQNLQIIKKKIFEWGKKLSISGACEKPSILAIYSSESTVVLSM